MIDISRIKVKIMKDYPFFGALLHTVKWVETKAIPTAAIDGDNRILINPDYFSKLTEGEQIAGGCHEILHGCFLHHPRIMKYRTNEDKILGNHAADYLINFMIKDCGLPLNPNWLYNEEYSPDKYSLETLFDKLKKDNYDKHKQQAQGRDGEGNPQQGQGLGAGDDISPEGKPMSQKEQREREVERKLQIASAMAIAKKRGQLPASIERFCTEILKPKQNWKEELREWFNVKIKDVTTWNRPNRRFAWQGKFLPTKYSEGCGHIGVAIDVSGSISAYELAVFESELNHIFELCKPTKVTVVYFDTNLHGPTEFEELPIRLKAVGGGGTSFNVAFDYFNNKCSEITGLVFMTDMYGEWPKEPKYPVCVLSTTPKLVAPYGKTIHGDLKERN
jgi:predicted metal-dependent peptidase